MFYWRNSYQLSVIGCQLRGECVRAYTTFILHATGEVANLASDGVVQVVFVNQMTRLLPITDNQEAYKNLISRRSSGKLICIMNTENQKKIAAEKATENVQFGMIVGLGTGSTVYYALLKLGTMVREGLDIIGIPTSEGTEKIAKAEKIPLTTLATHPIIDLTIDGADEVDAHLNLIKGGGAALVREKIIANASKEILIVVDESKVSRVLGTNFPLPVEIVRFGWEATQAAVNRICGKSTLRQNASQDADASPLITDNGNYILDCHFDGIPAPAEIEMQLNNIPGVVENGIFANRADQIIIGTSSGIQYME